MLGWLKAAATSVVGRITFARQQVLSLVANWLAGAVWLLDTAYLTLAKRAYGGNAIAYACIRLLSQSVPEPPLRSYQEDPDGNRTELARDHPLRVLIRRPNELMTEYEFWELTTIFMAITGSAFYWKQRANSGQVIALWPLRPDRVGPIYSDSDKAGERLLAGWSYQDPGSNAYVPIPRRDVLCWNFPDPADQSGGIVEGLGPLQVLAAEISADNEATAFVGALLKNYAAPSMLLKIKQAVRTEEEAQFLKQKAAAEFGGSNRGKVGLLDADSEVQMVGFNMQQLEFPDLRSIAEARVAAAVGVPAILVGLKVGLDRSTFSNLSESRAFFAETTLSNYWRRYADKMTNDLAAEFGPGLVCEFDTSQVRALAGQRVEKIQPIKEAFEKSAATRGEYRAALGLPPREGDDVYVMPGTTTEVAAPIAPASAAGKAAGLRLLGSGTAAVCPSCGERHGGNGRDPGGLKLAADPRDSAERRLRDALVAMFEKVAPEVARKIAAGETVSDDDLAEAFRSVVEPELALIATDEGLRLGAEIGVQFDPAVVNAAAVEWSRQYTYGLVKDITATTRTVIANATEQFISTPGMTIGELRDALSGAFGPVRAQLISVTETSRAYAQSSLTYKNQLAEQGIRMLRVWHVAADERVCPICAPLDLKMENEWGDHSGGPPAHPGCRCSVTLALQKEKHE